MIKLCFDAGHYKNYNQSNVFKQYFEGNKMWDLHLMVKDYLEQNYDVQILLTRSDINKDLNLIERGKKAKGCEGFYSFHSNAVDNESIDRVVIIKALGDNSLNTYSKQLGDSIKNCIGIKQTTQVYDRKGNNGEYYGVLRGAKNVNVKNRFIIEHGFHTNYHVAKWLNDNNNLKKLAKVEGEEIAKFHKLKRKNSSSSNKEFKVKIICDVLRVRGGAGTNYSIVTRVKKGEVFSIINEKNGWGLLKSKVGWISLESKYVKRL